MDFQNTGRTQILHIILAQPDRGDYTEEYQCLYHEHMLRMIEERPWLWATHVWNMFDFAADGRDEGGKHGENQKRIGND